MHAMQDLVARVWEGTGVVERNLTAPPYMQSFGNVKPGWVRSTAPCLTRKMRSLSLSLQVRTSQVSQQDGQYYFCAC
jgi:hypothetical protein